MSDRRGSRVQPRTLGQTEVAHSRDPAIPAGFRLSQGGIFHELLLRLRLIAPDRYLVRRRLTVFLLLTWVPLAILTLWDGASTGSGAGRAFLHDPAPYVRYFFCLPLLVLVEAGIDSAVETIIRTLASSRMLVAGTRTQFLQVVEKLVRGRDSYLADWVILGLVALIAWSSLNGIVNNTHSRGELAWAVTQTGEVRQFTVAGLWFAIVSMSLLQIVLFRWFWRFWLWAAFLFRLSKIGLKLDAVHPDLTGGLGSLPLAQKVSIFIWIAFGAQLSVSMVDDIMTGQMTLTSAAPVALAYIVISLIINSFPLVFFVLPLVEAKRRGIRVYGALGHQLVAAFDSRWHKVDTSDLGKRLLMTAEPSAIADFSALYENVRMMRIVPMNLKEFAAQAALLALPFLMLALTQISMAEVVRRIIGSLL